MVNDRPLKTHYQKENKMRLWEPKQGPPRNPKYDQIIAMRKEGYTYDAIAYLLTVHRQTVASICQTNKLGGKINSMISNTYKNSPQQ